MRPPPTRLAVASRSGAVVVVAAGRTFDVDQGRALVLPDGTVQVEADAGENVRVRCAAGTHVTVGTASGRVTLEGRFGDVRVTSQSGRVDVGHAESVEARTASGNVQVDRCDGVCRVVTSSGKVAIGHAGRVELSSTNGRLEATTVDEAEVRTVSGRVLVGAIQCDCPDGHDTALAVRTTTGTIRVTQR